MRINKSSKRFRLNLVIACTAYASIHLLAAHDAIADCSSPAAIQGAIEYLSGSHSYVVCDGTNWVAFPNLTNIATCSAEAAWEYDSSEQAYKYCNGTNQQRIDCQTEEASCSFTTQNYTSVGTYTLNIDDTNKGCAFTITVKGAGGTRGYEFGSYPSSGGTGGTTQFSYAPGVTGSFNIYVGRKASEYSGYLTAGRGGMGDDLYGGGGGEASTIKFESTLLAIAGGGGGGGSYSGSNGGNGGSLNNAGSNANGSYGGSGGGSNVGGTGGASNYSGGNGGSNGLSGADGETESSGYGVGGSGNATFLISGGGGGSNFGPIGSSAGGGGGSGYGAGGGGGSDGSNSGGGGGGGGGYLNTSVTSDASAGTPNPAETNGSITISGTAGGGACVNLGSCTQEGQLEYDTGLPGYKYCNGTNWWKITN